MSEVKTYLIGALIILAGTSVTLLYNRYGYPIKVIALTLIAIGGLVQLYAFFKAWSKLQEMDRLFKGSRNKKEI